MGVALSDTRELLVGARGTIEVWIRRRSLDKNLVESFAFEDLTPYSQVKLRVEQDSSQEYDMTKDPDQSAAGNRGRATYALLGTELKEGLARLSVKLIETAAPQRPHYSRNEEIREVSNP